MSSFGEDECGLRAAALSYHALLSIFPLLLFVLSIGSQVIESGNTQQVLLSYVQRAFPQVARQVNDLISKTVAASTPFGIIGAAGLLWSASALFTVLTGAFNVIWKADPRPFWRRRLMSVVAVLALAVLFTFSLLTRTLTVLDLVQSTVLDQQWVNQGTDLAITIILLLVLYLWLPNRSVDWRAALSGAVLASFLWQIAKTAFSVYLGLGVDRFGAVYGSVGSVIVLILWVYFSSLILFLGAEVAAALEVDVWG
ncbi:MAG: YihY/virulence factor BrkB family protein [Anaerolineales bacterium]